MSDLKISQIDADVAPAGDDIFVLTKDPTGTPENKVHSRQAMLDWIEANGAAPASFIDSGTFADALIAETNVTQHEAAITITASQISDYLADVSSISIGGLSDVTLTDLGNSEVLFSSGGVFINRTLAEAGIAAASHTHTTTEITSGTFADARIAETNITQHQAALSVTESQISDLQSYLLNTVEDTTPQLGGNLDVNGNKIISTSNGNIDIEPNGTGNILLGNLTIDADQTVAVGQDNYVLAYEHSTGLVSLRPQTQALLVAASNEGDDLTTGAAKVTFRMPYGFTLTGVRASVNTAPTGAKIQVDVNQNGVTVLSTPITIDISTKTSVGAAIPPVISTSSLTDDAEISIDIDAVGSTIPGKGLKVYLLGYPT